MRLSQHELFLGVASLHAGRSTCLRRGVGCVLVDGSGKVVGTGYNGVPKDLPHCNEGHPCAGVGAPTGEDLEACLAVHAEQNALMQCSDVERIAVCYTTVSPCLHCIKMLLNTNCQWLCFRDYYLGHWPEVRKLWESRGRRWMHIPVEK